MLNSWFRGDVLGLTTALLVAACLPREKPKPEPTAEEQANQAQSATKKRSLEPSTKRATVKSKPTSTGKAKPPKLPKSTTASPTVPDPRLKGPFVDNFERQVLGPNWRATKAAWRIESGRLCGRRAHNHPVWLARRLPKNARIEFDAMSYSPDGDIKAEFWGDGRSAATSVSYKDATSYLTIFGGWKNRFHVLARIDEHAKDRPEIKINSASADLRAHPVEAERVYRFKVERNDGRNVHWLVDDIEILSYKDQKPLAGRGHEHFGFNNWEVHVCFDNLKITPLSK